MMPNIDTQPRPYIHTPINALPSSYHDVELRHIDEGSTTTSVNLDSFPLPLPLPSSSAALAKEGATLPSVNAFSSHATIMSSPSDAPVSNACVPVPCARRSGSSRACSMLSMFVVISGMTVAVACITIWIISYMSSQEIAAELSNHLRLALMDQSLARIETELSSPLVIADSIRTSLMERIPNITDRVNTDDDPAFFIDLANAAIRWPSVSRFSFTNQRGLALKWETTTSVKPNEKYTLDSVRTIAIGITTPVSHTLGIANDGNVDAHSILPELRSVRAVYTPHPIHSTIRFNPPFTLISDVLPTDTKQDIRKYLGEPKFNVNFDRLDSPTWLAALEIYASGRDTGWTLPLQFTTMLNDKKFLTMSACSVARSPHTGNMGATACVAIAMEYLCDLLSDLHMGPHGNTFLMTSAGHIVASGSKHIQALVFSSQHGYPIDQLDDAITPVLTRKLREWNLIQPNKVAGTLNHSIGVFDRTQESRRRTQLEAEIIVSNAKYHMRASTINFGKVGLPITLMQYTRDSDFARSVDASDQTIACVCCGALLFAIILSFVSALLFIRPLTQVIHFLTLTSDIVTTLDPHQHRERLIQLQKEFSQTAKCFPQSNKHPVSVAEDQVEVRVHEKAEISGHLTNVPLIERTPSDSESKLTQFWDRLVKYLEVEEAQALQRAFFFMISSLISIDTLQLVNEAKKAFIRYIFHEVRVPFSAMVLGLEQMRIDLQHMSAVPPSVNETIDVLQEQAEFITRILNEVLTMQKIEANQTELERSYFSMNQLIESTVHTFQVACESKGLLVNCNLQSLDELITRLASSDSHALYFALQPVLPLGELKSDMITNAYVEADLHRLRQVLSNFLSNAIKFTPRLGEVKVNLLFSEFEPNDEVRQSSNTVEVNDEEELIQSLAESHKNSPTLNALRSTVARIGSIMMYVSVVDTGIGISDEDAKNLFQPYRQIVSVHQKKVNGTGLGLSIAKSIIKLHGGVIGVQSSQGQGSEFFFRVRLPVAAVTHPPHLHHRTAAASPIGRGSPMEEPMNAAMIRTTPTVVQSPMAVPGVATSGSQLVAMSPFLAADPVASAGALSNLNQSSQLEPLPASLDQSIPQLEALTHARAVSGSRSVSDAIPPESAIDQQFLSVPRTISYETRTKEQESPREAYSTQSANLSPTTQSFLQGLRILVAEDSLPNRRLLLQLLRSMKCEVVGVENGAECCEVMAQPASNFDCILMDGCMPVMDGLEATRTLRQRGCDIPILGLTGHALAEDVNAFLQAGADAVYTKPISRKQIQTALKQHIVKPWKKSPLPIAAEEKKQERQTMEEQKYA